MDHFTSFANRIAAINEEAADHAVQLIIAKLQEMEQMFPGKKFSFESNQFDNMFKVSPPFDCGYDEFDSTDVAIYISKQENWPADVATKFYKLASEISDIDCHVSDRYHICIGDVTTP